MLICVASSLVPRLSIAVYNLLATVAACFSGGCWPGGGITVLEDHCGCMFLQLLE